MLLDVFGGMSAARASCTAAGLKVVAHLYVEIHEPAIQVVQRWYPDVRPKGDVRRLLEDTDARGAPKMAVKSGLWQLRWELRR